jgi:hypothetical protein
MHAWLGAFAAGAWLSLKTSVMVSGANHLIEFASPDSDLLAAVIAQQAQAWRPHSMVCYSGRRQTDREGLFSQAQTFSPDRSGMRSVELAKAAVPAQHCLHRDGRRTRRSASLRRKVNI